ncbi:2-amino-4-hydroxy-6-hydroxymethyldihydropteridine diphosphokinase [Olivibacter sp. SDN3]|uniref:2-amino-4-hydroxy-6- hydroxymethyldihydropteridine diphosphokinase n=1 Tax=Olivibacter sp. SDN3 TaxID=2764720 RepID=UPI00165159E0|nr:2-amino-4-hydroxy-6-hydroxymethyldihydropteridine diphosphokinase [Olivibacter sp. SDN3]QNL49537.1 2-amino-4-hydroxy-6-hydroxymethyldihydropteridine diphosphokinase [Olivibacter sp. SDN3]
MHETYLILGTNLGDRVIQLKKAIELITKRIGEVCRQSTIYETKPWGVLEQPNFLNQVLKVKTLLSPDDLLKEALAVEQMLGRVRNVKWGARLIDIDILFYDDRVINTSQLQIPHPLLHKRSFVLFPLAEIASSFIHPVFQVSISQLIESLSDNLSVQKYTEHI